ncbi:hypothetical protein C7B81_02175 [Aphanothece cf. minutissima CCALA 015]|uniref:Uncharacterized protein n=1 Tax=Aphanothece cf. minutissima CCALA 015 TaxID=2107695 RepID=A0ABX5FCA6_9CHRO|nr:hypothetical protein C7B81_02175 [Aphanothece cf. minutissima CCALA 015]
MRGLQTLHGRLRLRDLFLLTLQGVLQNLIGSIRRQGTPHNHHLVGCAERGTRSPGQTWLQPFLREGQEGGIEDHGVAFLNSGLAPVGLGLKPATAGNDRPAVSCPFKTHKKDRRPKLIPVSPGGDSETGDGAAKSIL